MVPFLTDEIDEGATRRRLDEITTAGSRALDEHLERSTQIDEEFRQAQARMEQEAKAMDELVADSHAKREAEDAEKDDQPGAPNQWASREAKPTVLSFFNEEHTETAPASAAAMPSAPPPPPAAPPPVPPDMPAEPPPSARVLSLGYEEDEPEPPPPPTPPQQPTGRHAARREAPPEDDDDLSDVNWMR